MPVARGPRVDARSALVVGASGVVVALLIVGIALFLVSQGGLHTRLGDDQFQSIEAESAAETIADGGPLIFRDLAGGSRDIFVQHVGVDPEQGWLAFDVRPLGEGTTCFLTWNGEARQLVDNGNCSRAYTFPADGDGLPQYPAIVNGDGKVVVDLNAADRDDATTSTESPTTQSTTTQSTTTQSTTTSREG